MPHEAGDDQHPEDPVLPGTYEFCDPDGLVAVQLIGTGPACDTAARASADEMERRSGGQLLITVIRRRESGGWLVIDR